MKKTWLGSLSKTLLFFQVISSTSAGNVTSDCTGWRNILIIAGCLPLASFYILSDLSKFFAKAKQKGRINKVYEVCQHSCHNSYSYLRLQDRRFVNYYKIGPQCVLVSPCYDLFGLRSSIHFSDVCIRDGEYIGLRTQ